MIQNIKIDTLYYLTNSDFEMEFNLCGCCKMRLLTDKAENAKNFVGLLARAVSRSQVIICCGKLFGDDGLIKIVSSAIRKPLTKINNNDFGIADSSDISIIDGSVPLVNSDGCFCGCIAESGPQSIILLTENKSIRKTVMKSLIHPYIEELSMLMHKNSAETVENKADEAIAEPIIPPVAPVPEVPPVAEIDLPVADITASAEEITEETAEEESVEVESENEETLEEAEEASDTADAQEEMSEEAIEEVTESTEEAEADDGKAEAEKEEAELPDVIIDNPLEYEEDTADYVDPVDINSGFGLYLEPERVKYKRESHYSMDYTPSEQDNAFISESEDDYLYEEDRKFLSLPILIVVIILLLALAVLAYMLILVPIRSDYVFSEFIRNIFSVSVDFV